jgi:NADP-dependent 3-hydroxy acid dehydrogenase YdfG
MIACNRGKIVNIGSVQSELTRPDIAPYTVTSTRLAISPAAWDRFCEARPPG